MTVDLKYLWNGVPYETDSGFIFDSNGCKQLLYDNNAYAGDYQFTAIRNSLNAPNGVWTNINPPLSVSLRIAAPNPTSLTANPTSIVMPGSIIFCAAGGANMIVDLQYTWNGVAYEADSGLTLGSDGCVTNSYSNNAFAGTYTYTGIRNSLNQPNGAWTTLNNLTVTLNPIVQNPVPSVASISPSSVVAGGGAFTLTVTGSNFINSSVVRVNGSNRTTTFLSSTQLNATIPSSDILAVGTLGISAFNPTPGGGLSNSVTLSVTASNPVPSVTSISPSSVSAGSGAFTLAVTGSNFINGSVVEVNGSNRTTTFVSSTQLNATIPANDVVAAGSLTITVFNPTPGGGVSNSKVLSVTATPGPISLTKEYIYVGGRLLAIEQQGGSVALSVTSISPTSGTISGGALVTIGGAGFQSGATVTLGGAAATNVGVAPSGASITATTPAHATGPVNVVITNPDSQSVTLTNGYTYTTTNPPPTVTSVSPASGTTNGGTSITIVGTAFQTGASVSLGGVLATNVSVQSSTTITTSTPSHAAGAVSVVVTNPDSQSGTLPNGYTYTVGNPSPTVTGITPSTGPTSGGTFVTIAGTSFVNGAGVSIGGSPTTSVTVVSATSITASTPAHAAGAANVVVTNSDGQSGTLFNGYTYSGGNPAPNVTGVTPLAGTVNGGTAITITGTGFQSGATVVIGGVGASGVTFVNSTSITAITPAHAAGSVNVTVTNGGGQSGTLTNGYLYAAGPMVTFLSPTSGTTAGGTRVTLIGSGFGLFSNSPTATFGGVAATGVSVGDDSHLYATTPARAAGVVDVVVTLINGITGEHVTQTLYSAYTYTPPFSVTAVSPNTGTINGGTAVTISGVGFVSGATVSLGGTAVTGVTFVNSTSLTATTPAHAAGAANVVVTNPGGQNATLANGYTYLGPAPTLTSISPTSGTTNGGTAITITGTGFLTGATVSLGGTAATNVVVASSTSITATTAAHAAGAVNVTVTNPDGQNVTLSNSYTFITPPPTITSISPTAGTISGGTSVTLTGTNFQTGATVTLGGVSATNVTVGSSTSITATTPAHAAGAVNVVVTNPDSQNVPLVNGYTYTNPVPQITTLSPSSVGAGSAAFNLTVTGSGFVNGSVARVNGSDRSTTFTSSTQLSVSIPATDVASPASLGLTVFNPTPGGGLSNSATLTVTAPNPVPSISSISPSSVAAGSTTFTLTVNGANFIGASVVQVNGSNRTTTFANSSQISAQIPSSDVTTTGARSITVFNLAPGGGTSNSATLTVTPPSGGLKGEYFNNINLSGTPALTRTDPTVNFSWGNGSPDPALPSDNFSVRWSGQVQAQFSETYTFYATTDDGVRLWVNGALMIDEWIDQGPTAWSRSITLVANQKYNITMEYYEHTGGASAQLSWVSPSTPYQIVPQSVLTPTLGTLVPGTGIGLTGNYFDNNSLVDPSVFAQVDPTINFNWGTGSPGGLPSDNFSIRWTGQVEPQFSETYTFYAKTNDGPRLWVNGQQIINHWTSTTTQEWTGTIALTANQRYSIKLEYHETTGTAQAQLSWSSPSTPKQIIPQNRLYP